MLKPRRTDISRQERPLNLCKKETDNKCRDQGDPEAGEGMEWEKERSHDF